MSLRLAAVKLAGFTCRRNLTLSAVALQQKAAADPIQQLFVEKVREYATKKKSSGGKLVSICNLICRQRCLRSVVFDMSL
jgi:F-type H+-transporting ATPase subunit 6